MSKHCRNHRPLVEWPCYLFCGEEASTTLCCRSVGLTGGVLREAIEQNGITLIEPFAERHHEAEV